MSRKILEGMARAYLHEQAQCAQGEYVVPEPEDLPPMQAAMRWLAEEFRRANITQLPGDEHLTHVAAVVSAALLEAAKDE